MNENLSELVQQETEEPMVFSETDLDLPETQEAQASEDTEVAVSEEPEIEAVGIITLGDWFEQNSANFENINQVKVSIRGIDPNANLIMAIKDGTGETDDQGEPKRVLKTFGNADIQPILALKGIDMQVYNNNTFRAICEYKDNIYIKCYGVRNSMIAVFCNNVDGVLVPYNVTKVKKTDEAVSIVRRNPAEVVLKLAEQVNIEDLQLRYKQASKAVDNFTTNQDAVGWLLSRQDDIYDINHHLQIDNVIIETLE
jgi:hypothetical protein